MTLGVRTDAPAPPGLSEHTLPAGPVATTLHAGPYDELALGYAALLSAVHERGHEARPPVVETYLTDPARVAPAELLTRLAVPLAQ